MLHGPYSDGGLQPSKMWGLAAVSLMPFESAGKVAGWQVWIVHASARLQRHLQNEWFPCHHVNIQGTLVINSQVNQN